MDKKKLEILLQRCKNYKNPKIELEQYVTPPFIAAELLFTAYLKGDIKNKVILDLGCGTGILAIGCKLLEARKVIATDVDPEAIEIARENTKKFNLEIEFKVKDVANVKCNVDTIVQNPPFGVRKKGTDIMFLEKALQLAHVIYTMHKSKTRRFILSFIEKKNAMVTDLFTVNFPLPRMYDFHRKERKRIEVDIYRIVKGE